MMFSIARRSVLLSFALVVAFAAVPVAAQSPREEFDEVVEQWRTTAREALEVGLRFMNSEREESFELRERYDRLIEQGNQQLDRAIELAMETFEQTDERLPVVEEFLTRVQYQYFIEGQYPKSYRLGQRLLDRDPENRGARILTSRAGILTNRFEGHTEVAMANKSVFANFPENELALFAQADSLQKKYERELELRQAEAEADDLPRVEIKTTKGTFVLELFENEAPDTVGNFISLVESGFYDGLLFHRVVRKFMAQGGGYDDQGRPRDPGYFIYDECNNPEIRHHFRGVISMAKADAPNTGNAQFFVTTVPAPFLDGVHTVFGRVIDGMPVVDRLNVTHRKEEEQQEVEIPGVIKDKILSARVLRKRDHEYKPNKVK